MANTSAQRIAETWVTRHYLSQQYDGLIFTSKKLKLRWGGEFAFDAVSEDGKIVCLVSTSASRTASGKLAMAKFQKLKADALYLLNVVGAEQLLMIFTEESMFNYFDKETKNGRFPPEVIRRYVQLPNEIHALVLEARKVASAETTPVV